MRRIVVVISIAALASGVTYAFLRKQRRDSQSVRDRSGPVIDADELTEAEQDAVLRELSQYT